LPLPEEYFELFCCKYFALLGVTSIRRMKSNIRVVSILALGIFATTAMADDKRDKQFAEIAKIKTELQPLRQKAYLEKDVIEARKKLDDAYKVYWNAVRSAMIRIDPSKEALIKKDIALRKEVQPISSGSRAEDYEKKAGK
jgi:hypothetical protein